MCHSENTIRMFQLFLSQLVVVCFEDLVSICLKSDLQNDNFQICIVGQLSSVILIYLIYIDFEKKVCECCNNF